jgi:hypothetical protein
VETTLQLALAENAAAYALGLNPAALELARVAGRATWPVTLRPYDLVAARFTTPKARVVSASVAVPDDVGESLHDRIADLVARVRTLGQPLLDNAGFEAPLAGRQLAGWTASIPAGGRVVLDTRNRRSGSQSLMMSSTAERVSVASEPFEAPRTGRLAIDVWLRTSGAQAPPSLRIGLEGELASAPFRPNGVVEKVGATAKQPGDWVLYSLPIENIPAEGLSPLRVRLELTRPGEVWIDDVQVRAFSETELIELSKINAMASMHLDKRQYSDCARLLEGYWPQFLVANVPLANTSTPIAQRPKLPAPPPEPQESEKKPSIFESMRGFIPQFR